jgi:hypothetical protein
VGDAALVGPEQPALEQAGDAVDLWHEDVRRIAAGGDVGDDVVEAVATDVLKIKAGACAREIDRTLAPWGYPRGVIPECRIIAGRIDRAR